MGLGEALEPRVIARQHTDIYLRGTLPREVVDCGIFSVY